MKEDIMNDERIEQLLRKAPRALPPAGLLGRLRTGIALPRPMEVGSVNPTEAASFIRRWIPALSFAAIFLACIVAIAVQTHQIGGLKHENATLQSSAQNLEQLRRDNAEYQRLKAEIEELDRLRRDFAELQQLRTEITQLRSQVQELDKLRAENQQLALAGQKPASANDDFFARNDNALENARAKAESMACINNLKQIGLAARIWATDNSDVFPLGWLAMTNELATPKILICPSDKARTAAGDWRQFSAANVSYEFLNPSGTDEQPQVVLARCTIHNHVCLSDGSVHQLGNGRTVANNANDGKYYIINLDAEALGRQRKSKEEMLQRYGLPPSAVPLNTNRDSSVRVEPPKPSYE
jgi:uncharacterized protein YlxW (UPF0749 family)